jgi:hypothetical protein
VHQADEQSGLISTAAALEFNAVLQSQSAPVPTPAPLVCQALSATAVLSSPGQRTTCEPAQSCFLIMHCAAQQAQFTPQQKYSKNQRQAGMQAIMSD